MGGQTTLAVQKRLYIVFLPAKGEYHLWQRIRLTIRPTARATAPRKRRTAPSRKPLTAAPTPPTDNKTLHCYAVPAGDVHAATPVRFWYFRSQDNRNASPYKKSKVENTAVPN